MNNSIKSAFVLLIAAGGAFLVLKKQSNPIPQVAVVTPEPITLAKKITKSNPHVPTETASAPLPPPASAAKLATATEPATTIPTNEEDIDHTAITIEYFEPNVLPLMEKLPSPCKLICNPTSYDWGIALREDPEYENKFFASHGARAFDDPEFRMRAEYLRGEALLYTPAYRKFKKAFSAKLKTLREEDMKEYMLSEKPRLLEFRKKYAQIEPKQQMLYQVFQEYRRIKADCNSDSPSELEKRCLKMMPPDGQFPRVNLSE